MNRPIKFRAWDLSEHRWWTPRSEYQWDKGAKELFSINQDSTIRFDRADIILMQFTGLLDKNGKDIYEGDIVRYTGGGPYAHEILRVFWHQAYLRFSMQPIYITDEVEQWGVEMPGNLEDGVLFEVVGNVYENPCASKNEY